MRPTGGIYVMCFMLSLTCFSFLASDWGFYAHRKINFYAALTIPPPLNRFFKTHISYLREHAVDPDRRRYATPGEGPRHFIDLDRWYHEDSLLLSGDYTTDRILMGHWEWHEGDGVRRLNPRGRKDGRLEFTSSDYSMRVDSFALRQEVFSHYSDSTLKISSFLYPGRDGELIFVDSFSHHGIVPYVVERLYDRLVVEMASQNPDAVRRICADIGHYIGDAHVPLHTTSNYNGQFTDQIGIHAFWESRIPELFEETHFNSLPGRAKYIGDIHEFIWNIVRTSYSLVSEVLEKERLARERVSQQNHYCYEERGSNLVRTQCPELTRAYMELMDGMVQERWIESIRAVGSVWYSAWMDAGQPDLWSQPLNANADSSFLDRLLGRLDFFSGDHRSGLH